MGEKMLLRAIVKGKQIIIPNYWNIKEGEVLVDVKLLKFEEKDNNNEIKETAIALIEHWEEEIKKEVPIDSKKIEDVAKKLGLKGFTVEDLIDGKF